MHLLTNLRTVIHVLGMVKSPFSYLAGYARGKEGTYELRNGLKLTFKTNDDKRYFHEIWIHKAYRWEFDIEPGDIVVDVGAQRGMFTLLAARRAKKVYAFEPMPDNYAALAAHVQTNKLGNVKTFQRAVSGKPGKMKFYLHPLSGSHSLFKSDAAKKSVTVSVDTIGQLIRRERITRIDFLKLDCEGAEFDILSSMPQAMLRRIGKIGIEYHEEITGRKAEEIVSLLERNGFTVWMHTKQTIICAARARSAPRRAASAGRDRSPRAA